MQRVVMAVLVAAAFPGAANSAPASTLSDFWMALDACSRRASGPPEATGSELTVLFSVKRDGSLQGKPRITYSHLVGDPAAQKTFVAETLGSIARCFPLPMTAGLGGAMAGRPIRLRIVSRPRERRA